MREKVAMIFKFLVAANMLAFGLLLLGFVIVLFVAGPSEADLVLTKPACFVAAWIVSIAVCIKYFKFERRK